MLLLGARADSHEPVESLRDIGDNQWRLIDKGSVSAPLGIMAYSGGWLDRDNYQFCIFGGGHFNYSGNEVWCLDIATLTWNELYEPDVVTEPSYYGNDQTSYSNFNNDEHPGALFHPTGEAIKEARPMSRHTYDQMEYIDGHGLFLWGGFAWGDSDSPWCTECNDSWLFEHESGNWYYLFDGDNPSPNVTAGVGASAYAAGNGLVYAKVLDETWTFDPQGNTWRQLRTSGAPPYTVEGTLEYDPIHDTLYFFGGNYESNYELWRFDIAKRRWQEVAPDGQGPVGSATNGPGMAYDTRNDVLAIYHSGTVWIFDPRSNTWTTNRPPDHPDESDFVFGRFRYDAVNNGFWLHAASDDMHATWFYRYKN
jgi:hypothetical protein